MSDVRVEIDLNDVDSNGLTSVLLGDAHGVLVPGETVTAYEPEDGVAAPARVESVDEVNGIAFLRVDWRAMTYDRPVIDLAGFRGVLKVITGTAPITRGKAVGEWTSVQPFAAPEPLHA